MPDEAIFLCKNQLDSGVAFVEENLIFQKANVDQKNKQQHSMIGTQFLIFLIVSFFPSLVSDLNVINIYILWILNNLHSV